MCTCSAAGKESTSRNKEELLVIKHAPNPVSARLINNSKTSLREYQWKFRTKVINRTQQPLQIISFGGYRYTGNKWESSNSGGRLFNSEEFVKWYKHEDDISSSWIQPGQMVADDNNWVRGFEATFRYKWRYVAVDSFGEEYVGEEEVELIPYYEDKDYWADTDPSTLVEISGKILGSDEKLLQYAQIRIIPYMKRDFYDVALAGSDGTYEIRAEIPGIYKIFAYSPSYNSITKTIVLGNDKTEIFIDFKMSPHETIDSIATENQSEVILSDNFIYCERIWQMEQLVATELEKFIKASQKHDEESGDPSEYEYDWSKPKNTLAEYFESESVDAARKFAAFKVAEVLYYDRNIDNTSMNKVFGILPPDSPYWGAYPQLSSLLCGKYKDEYGEKQLMKLYKSNPGRMVRAYAISYLALWLKKKNDLKMASAYYDAAMSEFSDIEEINLILRMANPYAKIAKGKEIPDFQVASIDKKKIVSKESMKGKYYLIHFWTTWCGPCKKEMKAIHDAYETNKNNNFTILSISFDRDMEVLNSYRSERWPLPWINAIESEGMDSKLASKFEVYGVPKLILVNPEGVILETSNSLRGQKLAPTLVKCLTN